jgi:segregation and condensation protein B
MGLRSLTELPALTEIEKIMDLVEVAESPEKSPENSE